MRACPRRDHILLFNLLEDFLSCLEMLSALALPPRSSRGQSALLSKEGPRFWDATAQ